MNGGLSIKEVAERTGVAAGTLRMWEQRYGFPLPDRTPSGYRRYRGEVVEAVRRVVQLREGGLSMAAAIDRARERRQLPTDRPSIYAAVTGTAGMPRQRLRKATLIALSRAIEDEALARAAGPVAFGAFQRESFYRGAERRYRELARVGDAVTVFADFGAVAEEPGEPLQIPIGATDALGSEWVVVVDAPGFSACLLAWEPPEEAEHDRDRVFEAVWTVDPRVTREAAVVAARLVGRADPAQGERLEALLSDRPLAVEHATPALTALTNRMIAYLQPV
jgi:MerR family transcriptional regulator, light-induced transcriptional regulator